MNTGGRYHKVWIAFRPTQVKALDNEGTFDPTSGNMYKEWNPELHPRGKDGRFIHKLDIAEAAKDLKKATDMFRWVKLEDRPRLVNALAAAGMDRYFIRRAYVLALDPVIPEAPHEPVWLRRDGVDLVPQKTSPEMTWLRRGNPE